MLSYVVKTISCPALVQSLCVCWLVAEAPDENHEGISVACGSMLVISVSSRAGAVQLSGLHTTARRNMEKITWVGWMLAVLCCES